MRLSSLAREESRWPFMTICWSRSCLATSLADEPETSIHVLERAGDEDEGEDDGVQRGPRAPSVA